jgi:phage recombination protein Bet
MGVPEVREPDLTPARLTPEQVDLITRTVAKGANKDELALFLHACKRTGLDPLMRQIHAVKRWDAQSGRETMTIQTGIDGLRLVAERTGCYSPGREPSFTYADTGDLIAATAYVKKMTADGTWHEVAVTAHFKEYVQKRKDGQVTAFWARMPHVMLAKCAEALALRRAFPMELSGIYAHEEMTQATPVDDDAGEPEKPTRGKKPAAPAEPAAVADGAPLISEQQVAEIDALLRDIGRSEKQLLKWLTYGHRLEDIRADDYAKVIEEIEKRRAS